MKTAILSNLPDEILLMIFEYLSPTELVRIATISKLFWRFSNDQRLWCKFIIFDKLSSGDNNSLQTRTAWLHSSTHFFKFPEIRQPAYLCYDKVGVAWVLEHTDTLEQIALIPESLQGNQLSKKVLRKNTITTNLSCPYVQQLLREHVLSVDHIFSEKLNKIVHLLNISLFFDLLTTDKLTIQQLLKLDTKTINHFRNQKLLQLFSRNLLTLQQLKHEMVYFLGNDDILYYIDNNLLTTQQLLDLSSTPIFNYLIALRENVEANEISLKQVFEITSEDALFEIKNRQLNLKCH